MVVSRPDVRGREEILRVHTRKIPLNDDVNLAARPRHTGILRRGRARWRMKPALVAARQNRKTVRMWDSEQAKDRVLMGAERKSMLLSDEEKGHRVSRGRPPPWRPARALRPLHKDVTILLSRSI